MHSSVVSIARRCTAVLAPGFAIGFLGVALIAHIDLASGQVFGGTDYSGAELFERYCAACHGTGGYGDGPVAASLVKVVPDLTRLRERAGGEFPARRVADIIDGRSPVLAHGTRSMPVWGFEFVAEEGGDITAEQRAGEMIRRLIDHLEVLQEP